MRCTRDFEAYKALYPKAFTSKYTKEQEKLIAGLDNNNYGWYPTYSSNIKNKDELFWTWVFMKFALDERQYRIVHQSFKALYLSDDISSMKPFVENFASKNNKKLSYVFKDIFNVKNSDLLIKDIHYYNGHWDEILALYGKAIVLHNFLLMIMKYTDDDFVILEEYSMKFKSFLD